MADTIFRPENTGIKEVTRVPLSLTQIINMSFGFMGIQMGFALQNANMSRIFENFGVKEDDLAFLWMAGPVTGLIVQPIIGYYSDRLWHPTWGRRRPFLLIGALLATLSLCLMPNSPTLWFAAGMFWIMDASFNITMEPFRALVGDTLPPRQRTLGFAVQTIFIGIGAWIASQLPTLFTSMGVSNIPAPGEHIPDTVKYSFYCGALGFLVFVLYSVFTTKEIPPANHEALKAENQGVFDGLIEAFSGIKEMPNGMIRLAVVQFFSWLALFHMWIYTTPAVTQYICGTTDSKSEIYNNCANTVGSSFGTYNIVSAIIAFILPYIASKITKKYTHLLSLVCGGIALIAIRYIPDVSYMHFIAIGIGIAWSSILTMPYAMLTNVLPSNRIGYFVGVFNFFIVLPQLVASLFSKAYIGIVGGDAMTAVTMGGISLLIAAVACLFIEEQE